MVARQIRHSTSRLRSRSGTHSRSRSPVKQASPARKSKRNRRKSTGSARKESRRDTTTTDYVSISEDTESEPLQGPASESDSELGQLLNSVGGKGNKAFESALQKLVEQKVQAVLDMTMEKRQS